MIYYTRIWDKFIDFKEFNKIAKWKTRLTCMNSLCTSLMMEREWFKSCFFTQLSMEQRVPRDEVYNTSVSIETDSYYHIPNPSINCTGQCRAMIQLYFVDVFSWIQHKVMDILRWMVSFHISCNRPKVKS